MSLIAGKKDLDNRGQSLWILFMKELALKIAWLTHNAKQKRAFSNPPTRACFKHPPLLFKKFPAEKSRCLAYFIQTSEKNTDIGQTNSLIIPYKKYNCYKYCPFHTWTLDILGNFPQPRQLPSFPDISLKVMRVVIYSVSVWIKGQTGKSCLRIRIIFIILVTLLQHLR